MAKIVIERENGVEEKLEKLFSYDDGKHSVEDTGAIFVHINTTD